MHLSSKSLAISNALTLRLAAIAILSFPAGSTIAAPGDVMDAINKLVTLSKQEPHPAIVEVLAKDKEGLARGSGSLVYVDSTYGYILTNWHVVRDGIEIDVRFPDTFSSSGTTVKMDEHWDLALVRIWKPKANPLLVAGVVPVPGDFLTIAGYGQGSFRAARGKCIHYAAPDANRPFEMVEVSVEARQGDSGGPILNERGELAGVLFGAGDGATTGSHIGRVKRFLDETFLEQQRLAQGLDAPPVQRPPLRQPPPPFVPTQQLAGKLPMPAPSREMLAVPEAGPHDRGPMTKLPRSNGPVAKLGTPLPIDLSTDEGSVNDPVIELPAEPNRPVLVESHRGSSNVALPTRTVESTMNHETTRIASQPTASSSPVPLPVMSLPAAAGPSNQHYGLPGFALDRSVAEKLFEATKSVLAIVGAIAIVFQFAKASLRKK